MEIIKNIIEPEYDRKPFYRTEELTSWNFEIPAFTYRHPLAVIVRHKHKPKSNRLSKTFYGRL